MLASVAGHPMLDELLRWFLADDADSGSPYVATMRGFEAYMAAFGRWETDPGTAAISSDLLDPLSVLTAHKCSQCTTAEDFMREFPSALLIHVSGLHKTVTSGEQWFDKDWASVALKSYSWMSDNSMALLLATTVTSIVSVALLVHIALQTRKK